MPRLLVVGVSTEAVCGVRDYAAALEPGLREAGFEVETLWWQRQPGAGLREARRFAAELGKRAGDADLVLLHYSVFSYGFRGLPLVTPLVARALAGTSTVAVLHELAYPWRRRGWRGFVLAAAQRAALALLLRAVAGAVVTTEGRERWLRTRRWLPRRPVLFAPVVSNLPAVEAAEPNGAGPVRIGVFGFRREGLAADIVVQAVARLDDARLVLLGDPGPEGAERWRRAATAAGCGDAIELGGARPADELAHELASVHAVVFPAQAGPTPRKGTLAAALAAGKAIVALDGPERWEPLVSAGAVTLARPEAQAVADQLARLARDPGLRRAQGERARRFYAERMSPAAVVARLDPFLRSLVTKPRVALVAHDVHDGGGMERAFAELIRRGHRDCRFVVVSATLAPELRPLVEWRRISVPPRPFPLKFVLFYLLAGARLRTVRADLVHVLGAIVPRRADVATVQFCHAGFRVSAGGLAPEGLPLLRRANTALTRLLSLAAERRTYRPARVGLLAPVSRGVAGELERHYGGIPLTVTPNGVDTGRFRPDPAVRSWVRAELGAAEDETVLLFVGGDWDRKGLGVTIGALGRAPERLRLWIVGRGPEARFRALARERGVEERVTFLGPRSDAERFYQGADVFVLPTLYETFSIAAHEAAASALPVVATAVSGIEELVGADESGILVERGETALAAALARLAGDPALRARLGEEGRRRAERLDWERSARSVLDTYSSLLAEARC